MTARPIWIDTDPGFDDAAALALAASSPALRVEGIGVVAGNAPLERVLDNALRVTEALGLRVPVYAGCNRPLVRPPRTAERVLGAGALGSVGRTFPPATGTVSPGHAALRLIEAAARQPGELTLVAIGPLTTIALAMRLEPGLAGLLREVVLMGGSSERGNETAAAEFNVYADPEAAAVVFSSGARLTMFGLNLTRQVLLGAEHVERVRASGAVVWADTMAHYLRIRDRSGRGAMPLHDPVTVAYLLEPGAFTLQAARVEVEVKGTHTLGATVCEFRVPERGEANATLGVTADGPRVMDMVVRALGG